MDKVIEIISTYNKEKDKALIFSSVYYLWTRIIGSCHDNDTKRVLLRQFIVSLKYCIHSFSNIDYIDYRKVVRDFIAKLNYYSLTKVPEVKTVIDEYELQLEHTNWHYPYVDIINRRNINFHEKAILIIDAEDFIKNTLCTLNMFNADDKIKIKFIYEISDVFKSDACDVSNTYSKLSDAAYNILMKGYEDGIFDPFSYKYSKIDLGSRLEDVEKDVWVKYQIFLIVGMDDLGKIISSKEEIDTLKSAKSKLLGFRQIIKSM